MRLLQTSPRYEPMSHPGWSSCTSMPAAGWSSCTRLVVTSLVRSSMPAAGWSSLVVTSLVRSSTVGGRGTAARLGCAESPPLLALPKPSWLCRSKRSGRC
jgi:hypothetical protein